MDNFNEILEKLREVYNKCNALLGIAYQINSNENTRTAFSQKTTTYMPDIMQTLSFIISEFEREEIEEKILKEAAELEADYENY